MNWLMSVSNRPPFLTFRVAKLNSEGQRSRQMQRVGNSSESKRANLLSACPRVDREDCLTKEQVEEIPSRRYKRAKG